MNKANPEVEEGEVLGLRGPNNVGLRNVDSYEFEKCYEMVFSALDRKIRKSTPLPPVEHREAFMSLVSVVI